MTIALPKPPAVQLVEDIIAIKDRQWAVLESIRFVRQSYDDEIAAYRHLATSPERSILDDPVYGSEHPWLTHGFVLAVGVGTGVAGTWLL